MEAFISDNGLSASGVAFCYAIIMLTLLIQVKIK